MTASLQGIRVVCFYPWSSFDATGAWSRFSSLWRFLVGEGAEVTLAFLEKGNDAHLRGISVRYLGESPARYDDESVARIVGAAPELKACSPTALDFLLRYEKELYLQNAKVGPWLDRLIGEHDIVTCEYPMYAPLLSDICKKRDRPLVVTCHDMLFELHGTNPKEKELFRRAEVQALRCVDALVFCNDSERLAFEKFGLKGRTVLNTGDALAVTPGKEDESRAAIRTELKITTADYCLFVGSAHGPNVEAVAELRRLAKTMPEMTFVVAGKCCEPAGEGNFIAVGFRSETFLDALYRGALVVLVPLLRGTGNSVKLFQAFIFGKAVVSTPVGARGHDVADERELLIVPKAAEFAAAIRRLVTDGELRKKIAATARHYALRLDFRTHFQPYREVIGGLLNRPTTEAAKTSRALILVDNNLTDRIGHHCNYALALKQQCTEGDVSFSALIKRTAQADVVAELSAEAVFSQGIHEESPLNPFPADWGPVRGTYDFLLSNDCFAKELEAGLARRARPSDVVFLPNATPRQMLGVALLLLRNPIYQTLQFVLLLRFSVFGASGPLSARKPGLDKESAEKHAMAIKLLHHVDRNGSVRLATDSEGLAKEFKGLSERPIEVLPIPHTSHRPPDGTATEIPAKAAQKIRVVYLGDAREEKGFELLPSVLRACGNAPSVEFVFQAFVSSHYHQRMAAVIEELARVDRPNVRLIRAPLSPDAYGTLLNSADLVLLPYDAVIYRARTSGPFVEAICAGKPVVAPAGSWMSAQLADSGAGVTFVSGNPQDFARAVQTALANLPTHALAAEKLRKQFRDFHNPRNFLQHLTKLG